MNKVNGIRKEVESMERYIGGKPVSEVKRIFNLDKVIKMASNENPLGCSKKVKETIKSLVEDTAFYPDGNNFDLRKALSKEYAIREEKIILGAGSSSLIKVICNTLINKDDETIMGDVSFALYETFTTMMGGKSIKVPMKDLELDLDAMLEKINDKTKILWLCNPNNPTGTFFNHEALKRVIENVPEHIYVIVDEAYNEYVTLENYPKTLELMDERKNIIILRTFSKVYGLASLRVGYGICHEDLAEKFNRVISPFEVNLYAQNAAVTALNDKEFVKLSRENNRSGREYFYKEFNRMGLEYKKSQSNFILVDVKGKDKEINDFLLKSGYIVRPGYLLGCPGYLRITIGLEEENKALIDLIKEYFGNL